MAARRPGSTFLGYVVTMVPLAGILVAFHTGAFAGLGWHGGQYAEAFVVGTVAALVGGAVLRLSPAWRPVGRGVLLAGVTGFGLMLVFMVWVGYVVSHLRFV